MTLTALRACRKPLAEHLTAFEEEVGHLVVYHEVVGHEWLSPGGMGGASW